MEVSDQIFCSLDSVPSPYQKEMSKNFDFWVKSIFGVIIALLGLVGNAGAVMVLSSKLMRKNPFNILLIGLIGLDFIYLFFSILDIFTTSGNLVVASLKKLSLVGSIFMTMAIAFERHFAMKAIFREEGANVARFVIPSIIMVIPLSVVEVAHITLTETGNS